MLSMGCSTLAQPQQYRTHTVEKGETVYSIAKKYNTTEAAIYQLNPDAKKRSRSQCGFNHPDGRYD